eukprot:c23011_g1_i2 orf=420-1655(+)
MCSSWPMRKNDDRVTEWEEGLPSPHELTPLSQSLISPELAAAFSITEKPFRTSADVQRASYSAVASLRRTSSVPSSLKQSACVEIEDQRGTGPAFVNGIDGQAAGVSAFGQDGSGRFFPGATRADQNVGLCSQPFQARGIPAAGPSPHSGHPGNSLAYGHDLKGSSPDILNGSSFASYDGSPECDPRFVAGGVRTDDSDGTGRKSRKVDEAEVEEADSGAMPENSSEDQAARTLKRPRLVWTPQLHKRFVDAVAHLGIKNAVPKTIMQLMNVEGLTRENVASHLQKYRLYLKRMQGLSTEGPSASDQLFASTPVPPSLAHFLTGHRDSLVPIPFRGPVIPVPLAGFSHRQIPGHINAAVPFPGFDPRAYGPLSRTLPPRLAPGEQRDLVADNQSQPGSPSHHVLTLFPTSH